ncbi:MAG: hypothetical protein M0P11_08265 [Anaerolineaceae bacterium]|nr:hypothetical protein [Anaerolineaceae bacterium]
MNKKTLLSGCLLLALLTSCVPVRKEVSESRENKSKQRDISDKANIPNIIYFQMRDHMNKSIKILLTILVATSLVACSGSESSAQNAVAAQLKDPDSAKFGKFTKFGGDLACLGVNARNSMGGYSGMQQALLMKLGSGWDVIAINDISHQQCIDIPSTNKRLMEVLEEMRTINEKLSN